MAQLRGSIMATLVLAAVCCGIYPLVVYGLGQALFADKANGSLIIDSKGAIRGSALIGQNFTAAKYFHPRPSSAGNNGYDPASSSGSNLGPTSQKLHDIIATNIASYRSDNGLAASAPVPADAVTASASGLDQHISVENALLQAPRVAKERGLKADDVKALIAAFTDAPDLGFLGDAGVNVLRLNLALDGVK
ncbi:MAG TPA: K(+)-transporting ATPase subunit C [Verrucomicrobiae bacterium]